MLPGESSLVNEKEARDHHELQRSLVTPPQRCGCELTSAERLPARGSEDNAGGPVCTSLLSVEGVMGAGSCEDAAVAAARAGRISREDRRLQHKGGVLMGQHVADSCRLYRMPPAKCIFTCGVPGAGKELSATGRG